MMDLDTAQSIEVITVSTSSNPGTSGKRVVPLQIDLEKFPSFGRDESSKLRRPVRPIDRQRMRPWLMELLDLGNVFGLRWTNRHQGIFQISWRHASRLGWNLETDGDVFERWARHTGIYKEGDPPEPKRWKANFRCALHSLHDVVELTNAVERRGRNACRTYRFLQSNDEQSISRKRAKARRAKDLQQRPYEKQTREPSETIELETASSEELLSDSESEESQEDKVIVQKLDLKSDIPGEEYYLHHDHDYSAGPDKTQKTIVLRQGVGSIVLHKEVFSAPDEGDEVKNLLISNLDQLASAAMSSAGLETAHQIMEHGKDPRECKLGRKVKEQIKRSVEIEEVKALDNKKADFSLKNLPADSKIKEDDSSGNVGYLERNRRSFLVSGEFVDDKSELMTGMSRKGGKRKSSEQYLTTVKERRTDSAKMPLSPFASSSSARRRSGSPKILCRRSKRQRMKCEKSASESTEPLMSSCLLLLEAATRLDNAEKNGQSSMQSTLKGSKGKQNSKAASSKRILDNCDTGDKGNAISMPDEKVTTVAEDPSTTCRILEESKYLVSEQISQGILRSTLEDAGNEIDSVTCRSKPRTIRNLLKESDQVPVRVVEKRDVIAEAPCAKGLFSGSKIQSGIHSSIIINKKGKAGPGKSHQPKNNYFVDIRINNGSESKIVTDKVNGRGNIATGEEPLPAGVSSPTVKSNSGVQQTIIQRGLPVLSSSVQKTVVPVSDSGNSVLIAHKLSGSGGSPQIFMSSGSSLLQSIVFPVGSNPVGARQVVDESSNTQDSSSDIDIYLSSSVLTSDERKTFVETNKNGESSYLQDDRVEQAIIGETYISIDNPQNVSTDIYSDMITKRSQKKCTTAKSSSMAAQKGVSRTISLGMPAISTSSLLSSQNSLCKPLSAESQTIVTSADQSAPQIISSTNDLISLKSAGRNSHTLILTNSQKHFLQTSSTSGQKRDVLVFDHGKELLDEIKLHVVPLENSGETSTTLQTIINRPAVSRVDPPMPSQGSAVAQVVFDTSKGTLFKVSATPPVPLTSVGKTQMALSVQPSHLSITTPPTPTTEDKTQLPVMIAEKAFNVNSIPTFTSNIDEMQATEGLSISHSQAKCEETKRPIEFSVGPSSYRKASKSITVTDFKANHDAEKDKNSVVTVSQLQGQLNDTVEECPSQVLNFPGALQVPKTSFSILEAGRPSFLHGATSVKSLAEICKSYLAHLFSSLDNQTSESEENESLAGSPSVEGEEEFSSTCCSNQCDEFHQDDKPVTLAETNVLQTHLEIQLPTSVCKAETVHQNVYTLRLKANPSWSPLRSHVKNEPDDFRQLGGNSSLSSNSSAAAQTMKSNPNEEHASKLSKTVSTQESQGNFRNKSVMDPTAPLSIGEIPLFANSKGDSDSLSPASD